MDVCTQRPPARLRLRYSELKRNTDQLGTVADALRAVDSVIGVEVRPITGGMLIHYDAAARYSRAFWNDIDAVLRAHHLAGAGGARECSDYACTPASELGRRLADGVAAALGDKLVYKLIERSAVALLAAWL